MLSNAWKFGRLRPMHSARLYSDLTYRRLADKTHRSHYASVKKEAARRQNRAGIELRPSVSHFLIWLHHKKDHKLWNLSLPKDGLPSRYKESTVLETLVFHILTCLHSGSGDAEWLAKQEEHLSFLHDVFTGGQKRPKYALGYEYPVSAEDVDSVARCLHGEGSALKKKVIEQALRCVSLACPSVPDARSLIPWLRSLSAPSILEACSELAQLTDIPAFVTADILLRTPMEADDFHLQLDLWTMFMSDIGREYHSKSLASPVPAIVENLAVLAIIWNCTVMPDFIENAITFFTSTHTGYKFSVFTEDFCNQLIYVVALSFIRNGAPSHSTSSVIRFQSCLVKYLTNQKLSQQGYLGIVLAICHESPERAEKLYETALSHFPAFTLHCAIAKLYLSTTVEELMHHFNSGISRFPRSSTLWLLLIKKLMYFELLTESRSQKLLSNLMDASGELVISKEIILGLLLLVNTLHGIETFIHTLSRKHMLPHFRNSILTKYMLLLYKHSDQPSMYKPYLDGLYPGQSNLQCARLLYEQVQWKTSSTIGIMLNGEVNHQPEKVYEFFLQETQLASPNEACLNALLRASLKTLSGSRLMWGELYASQVAVHEFKKHVARNAPNAKSGLIYPSDKLWRSYIKCLTKADYVPELADIIRWWEAIQFVPKRSTLLSLLRGLPREFVDRHIKHARSVGKNNEFLLSWPWPGSDEIE